MEQYKMGLDMALVLFDRYQKWKSLSRDTEAQIRLLYLECKRNLAFLDAFFSNNSREKFGNSDLLLRLPENLETQIVELVFMDGEKNNRLFAILRKKVDLPISDEKNGNPGRKAMSLLQATAFVYVRVSVLKKLSAFHISTKELRHLRFNTRLKNIQIALLALVGQLSETKAVKSFKE